MRLIDARHLNLIGSLPINTDCYLTPRCPLWMGCDCLPWMWL